MFLVRVSSSYLIDTNYSYLGDVFTTTGDSTAGIVYLLTNAPIQTESILYALETGTVASGTSGTFSLQVILSICTYLARLLKSPTFRLKIMYS